MISVSCLSGCLVACRYLALLVLPVVWLMIHLPSIAS